MRRSNRDTSITCSQVTLLMSLFTWLATSLNLWSAMLKSLWSGLRWASCQRLRASAWSTLEGRLKAAWRALELGRKKKKVFLFSENTTPNYGQIYLIKLAIINDHSEMTTWQWKRFNESPESAAALSFTKLCVGSEAEWLMKWVWCPLMLVWW